MTATTRIISMHLNKGKTIAQCLHDRTSYAINPEKTEQGQLVRSYACDPNTVDAEFLLTKRQYQLCSGREQKNNVIAYQVRQSFKPGEVTPEEANQIGYEFAQRFLKGKHAFLVATHTDKAHIHNHIIWNSTALDGQHKFRSFLFSARAVARLSDAICMEHQLSVLTDSKMHGGVTYNKWLGEKKPVSHREQLRAAIEKALFQKPKTFEGFLALLAAEGYTAKQGKHLTFCKDGQKNIRLSSLGEAYSEAELRKVIAGEKLFQPKPGQTQKTDLLIDIQAKLAEGKGAGYARWAKSFNLKQMAQTVLYLQQHGISDYQELSEKAEEAARRYHDLTDQIKSAEARMGQIAVLKKHIIDYAKTKAVFDGYKRSHYSKKYLAEHEADILLHRAAKRAFSESGLQKLPSVKELNQEYSALLTQKKAAYTEYHQAKTEMRELAIYRENLKRIMGIAPSQEQEKEHGKEKIDTLQNEK